jgi:protein associated with RNAse G/E
MAKVKVRGIYSTALSKLFIENGFKIVQPSVEIVRRLNLDPNEEEFDVEVRDRLDRNGVIVIGKNEAAMDVVRVLKENLDDPIFRFLTAPHLVNCIIDVILPLYSKRKLDEMRRAVTPTLDDHHLFKTWSNEISSYVEQAEKLLEIGYPLESVKQLFYSVIERYLPREGDRIRILHYKLNGQVYELGTATVKKFFDKRLEYSRIIRSNGYYDGLEVQKEQNDIAESFTEIGEMYIVTKYYSSSGGFKGAYINFGTGVELILNGIRYVDLEIDLCVYPDNSVKVVDEEKLEEALAKGTVSEKLYNMVKGKVDSIISKSSLI